MPETYRNLGQVIITQMQPIGLKHDIPGGRIYDPSRIVPVPLLYLTSRGVEGENEKGERSHDIHHADHPDTRYKRHNAISIGFTSHYRVMRSMLGIICRMVLRGKTSSSILKRKSGCMTWG